MARSYLNLIFIVLIACTLLVTSSFSTPLSRTRRMLLTTREEASASNGNMIMKTVEKMKMIKDEVVMKSELDDYSPTGPNPYHTPKPPHG